MTPERMERVAELLYQRFQNLLSVPWKDLDTERERQHHLIGSHMRHFFYDMARKAEEIINEDRD